MARNTGTVVWQPILLTATALLAAATPAAAQAVRFAAHKDYSSGHGPASIAVGDVNGDSRQDLAVANYFSDGVGVLLGNADGSFQPPRGVYLGPGNTPRSVAIADFNGDGRPDLAVANPTSNTISVLPGNGDGTFQPAVTVGAGTGPSSVVAGDFNGDARPDMAAANTGSNNVSLLLGNGDGTFQLPRNFLADAGPAYAAAADVNRDGRLDLAIANNGSGNVSVLVGNGDGTFQAPRTLATGAGVWAVAVGDFNADGSPDLAAANNGANTVSVLLGSGDGAFGAAQHVAVNNGPTSVAVGDFNRDGRSDLALSSYQAATSSGFHVSVLLGNGDGTFQPVSTVPAGFESWALAAGDFNGDGTSDIAVANTFSTTISVLLAAGDGTFAAPPNYKVGRNPESVVAADFNRDGRRDLAVANAGSNTVSVLNGNGDGTFQAAVNLAAGPGPTSLALGDFNRDTNDDLVVTNYGSADYYSAAVATTVSVLLGNGNGTFQPAQTFEAGSGPNGAAVGDFNADGMQDLAVADYGLYPQRATTVSILLGNGDGTFRAPQPFHSGNGPSCVATGDFNRDGMQDLALGNYIDNNVSILLGNGDGTFRHAGVAPVGAAPWAVVVEDFNGDQSPDLAVTSHWSDIVSVLVGNGDGTFQPHRWFVTDRGPTGLALGDVNGDGRRDLIAANYFSTALSVFVSNGDGTLQAAQNFGAGLAPMSVAVGDFNGDGQPDLAAANYFEGSVSILINRTTGTAPPARAATPAFSPAAGTYSQPQSVVLSTATSGAAIHYTLDGTAPTAASPVYGGPISIAETTTIQAIARAVGMSDSAVASATYTIQQQTAAAPTFSPPGGTYTQAQNVTIATTTAGATIHYTTDGTAPTASSAAYVGPIAVSQTTTIRAIAVAGGMTGSDVAAATYTILQPVQTPAFSPAAGTYVGSQTVTISTATSGATIHYTTNGAAPTNSSPVYSGPIVVSQTMTIRAMAVASGMLDSSVASATYTIQVATPTFSPSGGTYVGSVTVSLGTATSGATIHYTTNGTTPTSSSPVYTAPIRISQTTTIRAIAGASGMTNSSVAAATYTIRVAAPAFSPSGGTYVGSVAVTLSTATAGATIHYTADGTTPTTASAIYTAPIQLTRTTTLRAMAVAAGMASSSVASAAYTVRVVPPAFSVPAGTYNQPRTVALTTATSGATIHYTTDGSTPTTASAVYSAPIAVNQTMTIRAMAAASGMANSTVSSATYTLQAATPTFNPPGGSYLLPQLVALSSASPGDTIYYTTDGSTPTTSSTRYTGSILVGIGTTTIRAIAVVQGWSQSAVASATYVIPF